MTTSHLHTVGTEPHCSGHQKSAGSGGPSWRQRDAVWQSNLKVPKRGGWWLMSWGEAQS